MADQAVGDSDIPTLPSQETTLDTQPQPAPQAGTSDTGPAKLLSADLLNNLLPAPGNGVSPLRVRRRGVRRLQYQDEPPFEQESESGDLGEHSLADSYIGQASSNVVDPGLRPPVYLPKRLISLRRKREASPIPGPNLIDALTNLLSPSPSGGQSGKKGPSDNIVGLGILDGASPLSGLGLGILTPASENDPDPFGKDGPAGNFFVE